MNNPMFFDTSCVPTRALVGLLKLLKVRHDGTLQGISAATQTAWFQAGKLRADIQEVHGGKREKALPLLRQLGLIDQVRCTEPYYDLVIVPGAKKTAVRKRLRALKDAWINRGHRGPLFTSLVLCGSNRPNDESVTDDWENDILPFKQPSGRVRSVPETETDMMMAVHELADLPWTYPGSGMDKLPIFKETIVQGRLANTRDTFLDWKDLPAPRGKVLIVSSQPYVSFQKMIAKSCFPHAEVYAIGWEATESLPLSTHLDNVAKIIFEIAGSN